MKDNLNDIVGHTSQLGFIDLIKVVGTDKQTVIAALAEDRSVMVSGKIKVPMLEFVGTFGMPNLPKLKTILGFDEYDEHATLKVISDNPEYPGAPTAIHFETKTGDFVNDYRLMTQSLIEAKLPVVSFAGATWNIKFEPKIASIQRLHKQSSANNETTTFVTKIDGTDLRIYFGDISSHSANFVFESNVTGTLARSWAWPTKQFISIMQCVGDKMIYISDQGAMKITVDSGIADYEYLFPAQQP